MPRYDSQGRVSFAVLALVVLLLANISVVYLYDLQRKEIEMANQANSIRTMRECGALANREVELAAHYIAMAAIKTATEELHNQTKINELFKVSFENFIEKSFPRQVRGFTLTVEDFDILVLTETKLVEEVVLTATSGNGSEGEQYGGAIETGTPGPMQEIERIAYYRLIGHVRYTISNGESVLETVENIATALDSVFPFLNRQLEKFYLSTQGSMSNAAQALRYILTTVAQHRVLLGYASGEYGVAGTSVSDILTPEDVEMAVNLVLILEQLRFFRAIDQDSVSHFDEAYFKTYAGDATIPLLSPPSAERSLVHLIQTYSGNGTVDPADIFVMFQAIDKDNVTMNRLLAQALYAMMDQFSIKYLDYIDFLPLEFLADLGLGVIELLANTFDGFVGWLTNHQKEADMVRQFIRQLFGDLGYNTSILGPVSLELPALEYVVTTLDGTEFNISLPAESHDVPFASRSFLDGHNGIWSSYFDVVYKRDLKSVHSGIKDLARDLANSLATRLETIGLFEPICLNGFIEPRDEVSILEYLDKAVRYSMDTAIEGLRSDPALYQALVANLWDKEKTLIRGLVDYLGQTYDVTASNASSVMFAHHALFNSLMASAASDPDFPSLDGFTKMQLANMIAQSILQHKWAEISYEMTKNSDLERFEAIYEKAVSLYTPPENGGIYQRTLEMIRGTTGLLTQAGEVVKAFLTGLMRNEEISNSQVLFPAYTRPFEFRNPGLVQNDSRTKPREERLLVDQSPDHLTITRLTRDGREQLDGPNEGELFVDILEPSSIPPSKNSPNVHFTQIGSVSYRPYETQWTVSVRGAVHLRVSTERAVYLDAVDIIPVIDEMTVPLNATLFVKTFSGWPLDAVAYSDSNTFGGDLWNKVLSFLEGAWDAISSSFGWVLEGAKFLLDQLSGVFDYLVSLASKILQTIYDIINKVIEILQQALKGIISRLLEALDFVLSLLPRFEFKISAFGFTLRIAVNSDDASRLLIEAILGSFNLSVRFVNIEKAGIVPNQDWAKWDILADFTGEVGQFKLELRLDPLMIVSDRILRAEARLGDVFDLDLVIPEIETYHSYRYGILVPIPIPPIGEVEIELGMLVRASERFDVIDVVGIIVNSMGEALERCGGIPFSLESLVACAEEFVRGFVDNLFTAIERQIHKIIDITFYIEAAIVVEGVVGFGGGASLTIEGDGFRKLFKFVSDNVDALLDCILDNVCDIRIDQAPRDIASDIFIAVELFASVQAPTFIPLVLPAGGSPEISLSFEIGANLAILGFLVGLDLGPWEIDFGMVIEDIPTSMAPSLFDLGAERGDIWIFKGTVAAP